MELTILTPDDLRQFKQEILDEIKAGFSAASTFLQSDTYLTSEQVCEVLGVSAKQFSLSMTLNYHIMQAYSREILGPAFYCS